MAEEKKPEIIKKFEEATDSEVIDTRPLVKRGQKLIKNDSFDPLAEDVTQKQKGTANDKIVDPYKNNKGVIYFPKEDEENSSEMKDLSSLPKWNCRVEGSPKDGQFTVGETFGLSCEGPTAEFLSTEITFKQEKLSGYELRVIEVTEQTENKMNMIVTSYVPKPHNFSKLYILDQNVEVASVEPFQLPVKSVITNPQQKPYGPLGALKLSYPIYLWIVLALVVLGSVFFGLFRMNRRTQMKKVIEELKQHNTALGAFNQFNKDVRTLGRQYIFGDKKGWSDQKKERYVESLDEVFRMYLLREFYVPALDWNSGLILKQISKQDKKRFGVYGSDLQKFLKELDRAKADTDKIKVHDCKQLTQMAKRVTQSIWKVRK